MSLGLEKNRLFSNRLISFFNLPGAVLVPPTIQSLSWVFSGFCALIPHNIFPRLDSSPLGSPFAQASKFSSVTWLLLHMQLVKEFSSYASPLTQSWSKGLLFLSKRQKRGDWKVCIQTLSLPRIVGLLPCVSVKLQLPNFIRLRQFCFLLLLNNLAAYYNSIVFFTGSFSVHF